MIIGGNKDKVIENIKKNIKNKEFNNKVELNDPVLSDEKRDKVIKKFYKIRNNRFLFYLRRRPAFIYTSYIGLKLDKYIEIEGLDNLKDIKNGAIITSNHFNPIDNMIIRKLIKKYYKKNLYIVIQETNLDMPGFLGYLMNHLNIIPLSKSVNYIINTFKPELKKVLDKKNYVLIYPEEEMWFNYKKPRPCKKGAYQFALDSNVPVISCFVEMVNLEDDDNEQFKQIKYILHVLKPIYKDEKKSYRENIVYMANKDYEQKKECYEKVYNKKLDYNFSYDDIAGLKKKKR